MQWSVYVYVAYTEICSSFDFTLHYSLAISSNIAIFFMTSNSTCLLIGRWGFYPWGSHRGLSPTNWSQTNRKCRSRKCWASIIRQTVNIIQCRIQASPENGVERKGPWKRWARYNCSQDDLESINIFKHLFDSLLYPGIPSVYHLSVSFTRWLGLICFWVLHISYFHFLSSVFSTWKHCIQELTNAHPSQHDFVSARMNCLHWILSILEC